MSEQKYANFTPGPWHWSGNDLDGADYKSVMEPSVSCGTWCYGGTVDMKISEEDKSLISAAPDLYIAADNALNALIGCCIPAGGIDDRETILEAQAMLRDAINKAKGSA